MNVLRFSNLLISHGWPNGKGDTVKVSWLIALGLVVCLIVAASFGTALAQSDPVQHEFRICLRDFALCAGLDLHTGRNEDRRQWYDRAI